MKIDRTTVIIRTARAVTVAALVAGAFMLGDHDTTAERIAAEDARIKAAQVAVNEAREVSILNQVAAVERRFHCTEQATYFADFVIARGAKPHGTYIHDTVYRLTYREWERAAKAGEVWTLGYCQ